MAKTILEKKMLQAVRAELIFDGLFIVVVVGLATDTTGQQDVPRHDGHATGVDGAPMEE